MGGVLEHTHSAGKHAIRNGCTRFNIGLLITIPLRFQRAPPGTWHGKRSRQRAPGSPLRLLSGVDVAEAGAYSALNCHAQQRFIIVFAVAPAPCEAGLQGARQRVQGSSGRAGGTAGRRKAQR